MTERLHRRTIDDGGVRYSWPSAGRFNVDSMAENYTPARSRARVYGWLARPRWRGVLGGVASRGVVDTRDRSWKWSCRDERTSWHDVQLRIDRMQRATYVD